MYFEKTSLIDEVKIGEIVPIFKKNDHSDKSNCQPVSLFALVCKN